MKLNLEANYAVKLGSYNIEIASATISDGEITGAIKMSGIDIPNGRYTGMIENKRFVVDIDDNVANIVEPYRPEIWFEHGSELWVEHVDADGYIFDNRIDEWNGLPISAYPIPEPEVVDSLCQAAEKMFDNEEDMIDWVMMSILEN